MSSSLEFVRSWVTTGKTKLFISSVVVSGCVLNGTDAVQLIDTSDV